MKELSCQSGEPFHAAIGQNIGPRKPSTRQVGCRATSNTYGLVQCLFPTQPRLQTSCSAYRGGSAHPGDLRLRSAKAAAACTATAQRQCARACPEGSLESGCAKHGREVREPFASPASHASPAPPRKAPALLRVPASNIRRKAASLVEK